MTSTDTNKLPAEVLEQMRRAFVRAAASNTSEPAMQAAYDASPGPALEAENARLREIVQAMLDAIDGDSIDSPEQGEPEVGIPIHKWHEEWAHYARTAFARAKEE